MINFRAITIVSGGQTGADRAALDFAIEHDIRQGGWCPRGRKAEDGPIDARYQLRETPFRHYRRRTEWNARDSDATVVFTIAELVEGGTALTVSKAGEFCKPCLHLARDSGLSAADCAGLLLDFLAQHRVAVLNVAGPRASQEPEVADFVHAVLGAALDLSQSNE